MMDEALRQALLDVFQQGRHDMTDGILDRDLNLYKALYGRDGQQLFALRTELYELYWLEKHWLGLCSRIDRMELSGSRKKRAVSMCAKYYKDFVGKFGYPEFEIVTVGQRKKILDILISAGEGWERDLDDMRVYFMQRKAAIELKIQKSERKD